MRWPKIPVDRVRPSRFHPPFCPWVDCAAHRGVGSGFKRNGSYRTLREPNVRIPRFLCHSCGHSCSRKTFSTTYYLKRPDRLAPVAAGLAAASCHRQIARSLDAAKTSITRMAERLSRHAILFHTRCLDALDGIDEPVVHDHFETFVSRQDHALGVGTAVGADTWFVYDVDPAPHRGSGRRPDRKPDAAMKPTPASSYVHSIRRTLERLIPLGKTRNPLILRADGRLDYRVALERRDLRARVVLESYPNPLRGPKGSPRPPEAIVRDRAMFPADQLHQLLRHTCADHRRETISFGRRLESIIGRLHLMAVWKNFIKRRSERTPVRTTPAMHRGLAREPWRWERILSRRLFPEREAIAGSQRKLYFKRWTIGSPELVRRHAA